MNQSRKEAQERGDTTYTHPTRCKYNHETQTRYTSNGICITCAMENRKRRRDNNPTSVLYVNRKARAKKDGILFTIEYDDIVWNTHCPVFGIELDYSPPGGRNCKDNAPSLDKVIPELGYVRGNVQVISWQANKLKTNMTVDDITALYVYINKYCAT